MCVSDEEKNFFMDEGIRRLAQDLVESMRYEEHERYRDILFRLDSIRQELQSLSQEIHSAKGSLGSKISDLGHRIHFR